MRKLAILGLLGCFGCGLPPPDTTHHTTQGITCTGTDVPIYKNQFQPFAGGSGVTTGADAAAGKISADSPSGPTAPPLEGVAKGEPVAAMAAACGPAACAIGEVAVEEPSRTPMNGGGIGGFGAAGGGDTAGPSAPPSPDPSPSPTPDPAPAPSPPPAPTPETVTVLCAPPPPDCAKGLSPQFTSKHAWECTDCSMVVTFGGIYGNYRRCVNSPTLTCADGQVPTFGLEEETWECKTKCDNGMYDQHTINGVLVCVPC